MGSHLRPIRVIDSHTAGEPTRVVISGGPDLGSGPLQDRLGRFRDEFDHIRSAVVNEPRGSDVLVGALLMEPLDSENTAGIIFFNNAGYLGMCGHGAIGVMATLAHLGRISHGVHTLETPVGRVTATLHEDDQVSIRNVPAYRLSKQVSVMVEGHGAISGDIAWGGNWFFLVHEHGQEIHIRNAARLTEFSCRIRQALENSGIRGANGAVIDHIELFAASDDPKVHSKNFVLCPGGAYDRSPCGTGTSAKLACLYADGLLHEREMYYQAGILDSVFTGFIEKQPDGVSDTDSVIPTIRGRAYITAESTLILNNADPLCFGISPG